MAQRRNTILLFFVLPYLMGVGVTELSAEPTGGAPTNQTVVEVLGFSNVYSDNVDAARNQAVSNSLITAIDLAAGELMPQPLKIERFTTLNQILYNQPQKYVLGYKVLAGILSGKEYRVLVEATISLDMLQEQLTTAGLLRENKSVPRVLFLISEQNLEDISPNYWWGDDAAVLEQACENQMAESLTALGFQVISHGIGLPPMTGETATGAALPSGPTPSDAEASAIGKLFEADMVIVGMAKAENAGNVMGESHQSFKGEFAGRALRIETGEKTGEISKSTVVMDSDGITGSRLALKTVGKMAAEAMGPQVMAAWQPKAVENITLIMIIEGTRNLANFVKFRNLLQELPMVGNVETSSIRPNEATLSVQLKGAPQTLADAIMLKSFDSFGINITSISEDSISLSLVPK
ncbi:MAG: hypothetical protein RBT11_02350 [Desulfobacterales bacterium]|jgi:hypothetical protein|nr:hypothetical protein [Desulfobacterales bacterium]